MMNKTIQAFLLLSFLSACSGKLDRNQASLNMIEKSFFKEGCVDSSCATVDFTWVQFEDEDEIVTLNSIIEGKVLSYIQTGEEPLPSLDVGADYFINEYKKFKEDFPESEADWFIKLTGTKFFDSLGIKSLALRVESYTGGAHGNLIVDLINFDDKAKRMLSKEDLILNESKLLEIAEEAFRDYHEIDAGTSLEEDGRFFLPESGFFLPQSIGYINQHFVLYYQPYEIGPYSLGSTELQIPLEKLRGVVRQ